MAGYATRPITLILTSPGVDPPDDSAVRIPVATDGSFRRDNLPAGPVAIHLAAAFEYSQGAGSSRRSVVMRPELARCELVAGETTRVDLDASRFAPAQLGGRVTLDGTPHAFARVRLAATTPAHGLFGEYLPDANGRFTVGDPLPPGRYRLELAVYEGTEMLVRVTDPATFELTAGQSLERDFVIPHGVLRLRFVDRQGQPLAQRAVRVDSIALPFRRAWTTDDDGVIVISPAPFGSLRIVSVAGTSRVLPLAVEIPASSGEHRFEFRAEDND